MASSGSGPRDYAAATERALYAFSGTTCYFPDCKTPVIVFVEGEPFSNVEIAHIRGANRRSTRYDPAMTDDERRSFPNLILLCKPHHELVDKRHPDNYPRDLLSEWKAQREAGAGIDGPALSALTEDHIIDLIEKAVASARSQRLLTVELGLGVAMPGQTAIFPTATAKDYFDMYADQGPAVLILTVRNQGTLKAHINNYGLRFVPMGMTLTGTNDLPHINPRPPHSADVGESQTWLYELKNVVAMVRIFRTQGGTVSSLIGEATLGSGETVESVELPVEYLGPIA
jgi:hypothetical protein